MMRPDTLLSNMLADVARAVVSTQGEMDRLANEAAGDLPLAPLAFVVRRTEVTLLGSLSVQRDSARTTTGPAVSFALVNRVQAGLRDSHTAARGSRVSILIEAVEPTHGR